MLDERQVRAIKRRAVDMMEVKAGFALTDDEKASISVVGFGQEDYFSYGAAVIDTIMHPRYGGRLIVFFPNQLIPEHWHPDVDGDVGKEETFRVLWGTVYIYGPGEPSPGALERIPAGKEAVFTSRHEAILNRAEQRTAPPQEKHWLIAGPEGAVALEISSTVRDSYDQVSDPSLKGHVL